MMFYIDFRNIMKDTVFYHDYNIDKITPTYMYTKSA